MRTYFRHSAIPVVVIFLVVLLSTYSSMPSAYGRIENLLRMDASPSSSESPLVTLQAGTAGTSTVYTNETSARVSFTAPAPIPTYYPADYSISIGTYVSGSVPASVQTVDTDYFVVRSSGTATSTQAYNPSGYNLISSTAYISGNIADLNSDNGVYMTFRSYVSATSTTGKTDAFIAYRSNTGNLLSYPKNRLWDGDTAAWGGENELNDAGSPVRFVRTAICPKSERALEKIVVTLSDDGYLDAYVFDGTTWTVTNNLAQVWTSAPTGAQRPYDITYETSSGRALLVYDVVIADATKDLGYRTWTFGTGWSTEYYIDFTDVVSTNPTISFIVLASNPDLTSNQIAMAFNDATNQDAFAAIWDGSVWSKMTTLTTKQGTTSNTRESIAIEYSTYYKKILVVAGNGANSMVWQTYTQGDANWASQTAFDPDPDSGNDVCFGTLKRYPAATSTDDYIMYAGVNDLSDLNAFAFDMADTPPSRINIVNEVDDAIDSVTTRPIDFAWESTGNKGLIVWGTTAGQIHYNTYTISAGWGASWTTYQTMGANIHPWVQLKTNPRDITGDVKILGAVLEGSVFDLGAIKWDGTTFTVIGTNTFSGATTVSTYECFDLEFQLFGDPTEFTNELEFTGTSNTEPWYQMVWTIDSAWTAGWVSVTIQVYNYTLDGYPSSGNGYDSYVSSSIANTDETRTQTITANPTQFRDSSGNWRIRVQGVKTTATQFDSKIDWVEFKPSYYSEYTVSTEFSFSNMTTNTPSQLNFTVVSQYDIANVDVTIQVWNYSSSSWATSGEGYLSYTSAGENETKLLSINPNPQLYTSAGNTRINITGVLTTTTQHQQKINQIKLDYSYSSSSTYDYVLKVVQVTYAWKVNLKVYNNSNIARLSNMTIRFHDGSSSDQIILNNGVLTQSEGPQYDLTESATIYISINNLQANATATSYLYVYLKILIPGTSVYSLSIITFQIR